MPTIAPIAPIQQAPQPNSIGGIQVPQTTNYTSATTNNSEGTGQTTNYSVVPPAVPNPAPVNSINSSVTAPSNPATQPTAVPNVASTTALGASLASFKTNLQSLSDSLTKGQAETPTTPVTTPTDTTTAPGKSLSDVLKGILALNDKFATKSQATFAANQQQGIADKTQKVQDLTNEYNSRSEYYDNQIELLKKSGGDATQIGQQIGQLDAQKNRELADIAIQHSAATGNLTVATTLAKQAVDAEFDPIQSQIDNLKTYYSLASNDLTASEKLTAEAAIKDKQDALDEQKQMRLKAYDEKIKQNDPLYQAQTAEAFANAAKTRSEALGGGVAGYNGDFGATINLAANTGGTNAQRAQTSNTLKSLIAAKDYPSAYAAILQATSAGLSGTNRTDFQNRLEQYSVTQDLSSALKALQASGYDTSKLTGGEEAISNKIGVLATDPKYAAVANQLNLAYQNYRHQMTGAAFSANEAAQYANVLPSAGNSFALNSAKIEGLNNFLTSTVDGYTKQVVGQGGVEIRKYAQGATPTAPSSAPADTTPRLLAPAEIPAGYYQASDGLLYKK